MELMNSSVESPVPDANLALEIYKIVIHSNNKEYPPSASRCTFQVDQDYVHANTDNMTDNATGISASPKTPDEDHGSDRDERMWRICQARFRVVRRSYTWTGTRRPAPRSSTSKLQSEDSVATPDRVVRDGHSRPSCAGPSGLPSEPVPTTFGNGTLDVVGQDNGNSKPSIANEAKQLYMKSTRTLLFWAYPKSDKKALPHMLEFMWENLPDKEKKIYFEQVLRKDCKDWPSKHHPHKIYSTSIPPPKLMTNPQLRVGLPIPPQSIAMTEFHRVQGNAKTGRVSTSKREGDQEGRKAQPRKRKSSSTSSHLCDGHAEEPFMLTVVNENPSTEVMAASSENLTGHEDVDMGGY